jgi:hypothetical protein
MQDQIVDCDYQYCLLQTALQMQTPLSNAAGSICLSAQGLLIRNINSRNPTEVLICCERFSTTVTNVLCYLAKLNNLVR